MAEIPKRALGRTRLEATILGYGAVSVAAGERSMDEAGRVLNAVLDEGINLIDTAAAYENSEEAIGKALATRRKEFICITKCGMVESYASAWDAKGITETIERSVQRLGFEPDVVLLHSCGRDTLEAGEAIDALVKARDQGKMRFIGYSGDNEALDYAIRCGLFDVVEASYNLCDQANRDIIRLAGEAGIGVLAKRPIANAVPGRTSPPASAYAGEYWPRWQKMELRESDVESIPWIEAALRFSAYAAGVTSAIVGSTNIDHIRENVKQVLQGPLPRQIVKRIEQSFDDVGSDWPGMT